MAQARRKAHGAKAAQTDDTLWGRRLSESVGPMTAMGGGPFTKGCAKGSGRRDCRGTSEPKAAGG